MSTEQYAFDMEDVEYVQHPTGPLLARLYRPKVSKPTAAVIELHGGGWSIFDRTRGVTVHEALARRGVFVMSLDFRQGAEGAYPLMLQDINYAVRWLKANAARYGIDPNRVALSGNSTGGHTAMLAAMRPDDQRYGMLKLPAEMEEFDATVRCVVMLWPVINPIGRYLRAKALVGTEGAPEWAEPTVACHDNFWVSEANMTEASPTQMLGRGEEVTLPPALWIRATGDDVHDYANRETGRPESEEFVARYRAAGGEIELITFEAPMMFTTAYPTMPESIAALDQIVDFVERWTR
ncbi:alpha/beta hydrolase [Rhizorhabdus sp.]|jgi:acetyl esterase|uniref:alpha/beta hydrolase n=1 Tax=Rhizorhabdus sp. TaxID=1968843 RepID=UPI001997AE30|nr:alpha/beta hydrolase [Rhizorhabdus sp.]MBD3759598.1 alpha/beta hydrolase [Rhizorhabdus sp.]